MSEPAYGYTKSLGQIDFPEALDRVKAALKAEGFGVLTEIDVKKTMKEKMNADYPQYRILGACNPPLAHRALTGEKFIGLLLPCNVIVFETESAEVVASIANPKEMFKIVENRELESIADEVDGKLKRVLAAL